MAVTPFTNKTSAVKEPVVPEEVLTPDPIIEPVVAVDKSPNDQLVTLLQAMSKNVSAISDRLTALENKPVEHVNPVENVLSITKGEKEDLPNPFAGVVPKALLDTAVKILGKKFTFECNPCVNQPAFEFVVIVPAEYSEYQGKQVDRRTKTIDNVQGANGVRDWCMLVKQNVVKYMGKQLPGTNLL